MICKRKQSAQSPSQKKQEGTEMQYQNIIRDMYYQKYFENFYNALETETERKELDSYISQLDEPSNREEILQQTLYGLKQIGKTEKWIEDMITQTDAEMEDLVQMRENQDVDEGSFADVDEENGSCGHRCNCSKKCTKHP